MDNFVKLIEKSMRPAIAGFFLSVGVLAVTQAVGIFLPIWTLWIPVAFLLWFLIFGG